MRRSWYGCTQRTNAIRLHEYCLYCIYSTVEVRSSYRSHFLCSESVSRGLEAHTHTHAVVDGVVVVHLRFMRSRFTSHFYFILNVLYGIFFYGNKRICRSPEVHIAVAAAASTWLCCVQNTAKTAATLTWRMLMAAHRDDAMTTEIHKRQIVYFRRERFASTARHTTATTTTTIATMQKKGEKITKVSGRKKEREK